MESKVTLLSPDDSLKRLRPLIEGLEGADPKEQTPFHPVVLMLFLAHASTVDIWKQSDHPCFVAWDENTGMPSHPTLMADANFWGKRTRGKESALLQSFGEWAVWKQEPFNCSCGRFRRGARKIEVEIMLRHDLAVLGDILILYQAAAVRSSDKGHLNHHYERELARRSDGDMTVVMECEGTISILKGALAIGVRKEAGVKEFNRRGLYLSLREGYEEKAIERRALHV